MRLFATVRNVLLGTTILPIVATVLYLVYASYGGHVDVWRSLLLAITVVLFTELYTKIELDARADKLFEKVANST